ncbi:UNVERIFIED_ORG: hypothetical protein ABID57_000671 [Arthrobacter sp. UYEF1]
MSAPSVNLCTYCFRPRAFALGWHGCEASKKAQATIAGHVEGMIAIGTKQPRTSEPWDRDRAKRLGSMAIGIKLIGGGVKPQE